ncbi:hypothetical protein BDV18DRAFT_145150 [Aspergillus unguis]
MSTKADTKKDEDVKEGEDTTKHENTTFLRVHKYDPSTHTASQNCLIEIDDYNAFEAMTLIDVRKLLVDHSVFSSTDITSPFCDDKGSLLSDKTLVKVYFKVIAGESSGPSTSVGRQLNIYYVKKKTRTDIDDEAKGFLKNQLDLNLKDAKLSEADVKRLEASFNKAQWAASSGGKQSHAADLSETQWSAITRTNCLLSGHRMVTYQKRQDDTKDSRTITAMKIERSPYSAFELKPRKFKPWEVSGSSISTNSELAEIPFRIPRFRVDDDSYVSVYETQTALEASLAIGSFSETSVEASAGGGFWGISAAVKAGLAVDDKQNSVTAQSASQKTMHVAYKFPRVTLYLDPSTLRVTDECLLDIQKVVDKETLIDFSNKYGDIFAQRVQLGGTLYASEASDSTAGKTKEAKSSSMKASAAASISASFAQASVSASHGQGKSTDDETTQQVLTNSMAWQAKGGDTLLCNNPSAWCATVGDYYNWRVIDQCDVLPLYKVLSSFDGLEDIEDRFKQSAKGRYDGHKGNNQKGVYVTFKFLLRRGNIRGPCLKITTENRFCTGHLSLWEAIRRRCKDNQEGFDKHEKDLYNQVHNAKVPTHTSDLIKGETWLTMEHHVTEVEGDRMPANSPARIQIAGDQQPCSSLALTNDYRPDVSSRWLILPNGGSDETFSLEPVQRGSTTVGSGDGVWIKSSKGNYLYHDASQFVVAGPWEHSKSANAFWLLTNLEKGGAAVK